MHTATWLQLPHLRLRGQALQLGLVGGRAAEGGLQQALLAREAVQLVDLPVEQLLVLHNHRAQRLVRARAHPLPHLRLLFPSNEGVCMLMHTPAGCP